MEEIKVGYYVRTKDGVIGKVVAMSGMYIELDTKYYDKQYGFIRNVTFDERITKHSPNIIDLIEVGDYVNGFKVDKVVNYNKKYVAVEYRDETCAYVLFSENDIKSIVTHEQFNSIKYEVE